jgi:hypothetical protein
MEREKLLTMRIPDWDPVFDMGNLDLSWKQRKQNKSMHFETLHRVASGELVPVEVTANYLMHNGKELSAGYFYDISERKAMAAHSASGKLGLGSFRQPSFGLGGMLSRFWDGFDGFRGLLPIISEASSS